MAYNLQYSDYSTTAEGPPDPARWVGPPGPPGPPGPVGPPGPTVSFNVRDYGVKMDGATDDSAALQAAANAAGAVAGSLLYFPPSAHSLLLSVSVYPASNQTWWAYPGSVTIAPTAGNTDAIMLLAFANASNVTLYGLTFDGGGQDFANNGIVTQAYHINGLTLDRVTFRNTNGMTFNGSGNNDLVVRGCRFINCGNHWKTTGHWADATQALSNTSGDGATWGFRTRIIDCTFSECGCDNINLGQIQGVQVVNNTFVNTSKPWLTMTDASAYFAAVFALFCTDVVIAGNSVEGLSGNAIDSPGLWEAVISNNAIRNSGQDGIGLFDGSGYSGFTARGTRNIAVTGNLIENSGQWSGGSFHDGIGIFGGTSSPATSIRIANNVVTDTQTTKTQHYGVNVGGTVSAIWVDPSNLLAGNATGPLSGVPQAGLLMDDSGNLSTSNPVTFAGVGVFGHAPPAARPTVTGAWAGNTAGKALTTALAAYGLVTDSTTA
jgi:hypothetical protein